MSITSILDELRADSSRLAKEAILKREKDNQLLKRVFKMAYDPTINFWIRKIPDYVASEMPRLNLEQGLDQLERLTTREFTGLAASKHLAEILSDIHLEQEIIKKIIERDLDVGATSGTANKVWSGLIPEYPYMRCNLPKSVKLETWKWKNGIYSQLKADGSYANITFSNGDITIMTRAGSVYPLDYFGNIVADIKSHFKNNSATHGELLVRRFGKILPREIGNGILNSVQKGGAPEEGDEIIYVVWDQIPLECSVPGGSYNVKYEERLTNLQLQIANCSNIELIETRVVHSLEEAYDHYNEMIEQGFEGTIIKTKEGIWKDSTSKEQVKLKVDCDIDVKIISFNPGKGKNAATFGSIYCESSDGLFSVNVSGFKDKDRLNIHNNRANYVDTIMTIRINNITKPTREGKTYSAFLPRAIEFRTDKTEADSHQKIMDQFDSIIKGKKK